MFNSALIDFDYRIFRFFNALANKSDALNFIFVALSEYMIFVMIAGLAFFVLLKKNRSRWQAALQALSAAFIGRALIVSFIRVLFFRARPFVDNIVTQLVSHTPLEGAFPSGHATVMFALAFSLLFVNIPWGIFYLVLAAASSISRVIVGVHFPLDIFGGMLVGGLSAIASRRLFDFFLKKIQKKARQSRK